MLNRDTGAEGAGRIQLHAPGVDRVEILSDAILAAGSDKADDREGPWPLAHRDVGNRVVEPVGEEGRADPDPRRGSPVESGLGAAHRLRLQPGIGTGRVGAGAEWAVELVERRQPPAAIGGGAQRQSVRGAPDQAEPAGRLPARAVRESENIERRASGEDLFAQEAVADRPMVEPASNVERQRPISGARNQSVISKRRSNNHG